MRSDIFDDGVECACSLYRARAPLLFLSHIFRFILDGCRCGCCVVVPSFVPRQSCSAILICIFLLPQNQRTHTHRRHTSTTHGITHFWNGWQWSEFSNVHSTAVLSANRGKWLFNTFFVTSSVFALLGISTHCLVTVWTHEFFQVANERQPKPSRNQNEPKLHPPRDRDRMNGRTKYWIRVVAVLCRRCVYVIQLF